VTLTEFLMARIAEDEALALAAEGEHGIYPGTWWGQPASRWSRIVGGHLPEGLSDEDASHIARHDPARVLADCEAKRRIVELHTGIHECVGEKYGRLDTVLVAPGYAHEHDPTLRLLALPYAAHPDYQETWRP